MTDVGINYQTAAGRTPLMVATARGSLRVMELLLNHDARIDMRDAFGQTAENFSIIFNQKQSRRTIIQYRWKKRNDTAMSRERAAKSALSQKGSETEQAIEKMNHQREDRLARLAEQRKKRQEQIATQQLRLPKKKSKTYYLQTSNLQHMLLCLGPQVQTNKRTSVVRFEDDENENDSDTYDPSPEHISMTDSTLIRTTSSLPVITQQSTVPAQKLFAHQFYDVYAGMTDEEWTKVRNAFVNQYLND